MVSDFIWILIVSLRTIRTHVCLTERRLKWEKRASWKTWKEMRTISLDCHILFMHPPSDFFHAPEGPRRQKQSRVKSRSLTFQNSYNSYESWIFSSFDSKNAFRLARCFLAWGASLLIGIFLCGLISMNHRSKSLFRRMHNGNSMAFLAAHGITISDNFEVWTYVSE